ncbi:outer membrane beta-barrel protein [Agarivorans aestuarii]|uniref:outer membrane beta-barrel protein n=1 Tax=Agarivorans aestuarii TaxID=1563703 RepID=UPI001C7F6FAC|nr:outer membrane beta-barrel protein [Agarivorans aestuarii]
MKNTLLALVIGGLTSHSVLANEFFIGGGAGYQNVKVDASDTLLSNYSTDAGRAAIHVRGGVYLSENHRVTATINYMSDATVYRNALGEYPSHFDSKAQLAQNEYLLSYDYLHPLSENFSLFGGATVGLVNNKAKLSIEHKPQDGNPSSRYSHQSSKTDFTYGLQLGMQYKLTESLSVDVQYRHMFESYSEGFTRESGESTSLSFPYSNTYTVSLDYRF